MALGLDEHGAARVGAYASKRGEHSAKVDALIGFIEYTNAAASICLSRPAKESSFQMRVTGGNGVVRICRSKKEEKSGYWIHKEFPDLPEA